MTRRDFGALLAVPPGTRIKAAVVGTGHGHAASKVTALTSMTEYEFVGIAKPDPNDPEIDPVFKTVPRLRFDKILDDPSIEMVAVESADAFANLQYAQLAVAAGKFVHLDKPPGASYEGLRDMLIIAKEMKRVVQMGYQWRYHAGINAVLDAARKGDLGRVYRFRASIDKPIGPEERAHLAKYKGGMMFSEGCHLIDRATALLGRPAKVSGFIQKGTDGLADNDLVVLEYPNAIAEISLAAFDPNGNAHRYVEVLGTNGAAKAQPFAPAKVYVELKSAAGAYAAGAQSFVPPAVPTYTPDFAELANIIRNGAKPIYTAEHDLMTHRVLLEACGMI